MPSGEKYKVLIVDDIAETRENLKRMLLFDQSIEVVGTARTGKEAIEVSTQVKPDVVLMDINMPDMDGIAATEAIRKKTPWIQIVILSVQSDANYMRRAMLAGARDFLTKPPMIDDLTGAIRRAGVMAQEERTKASQTFTTSASGVTTGPGSQLIDRGKILVVYSPKGGTGATTIAVNLAIALKTDENKVALVDANLQFGDVAVFLNEQGKNTILDLAPRVDELDPDVIDGVMVEHPTSHIQVLAAPRPENAEQVSGEQFGKLLGFMKKMYDYTIVDTPSYLTDVVLASIEVADGIVLVTTQEIPAIKNINLFLNLADLLKISRSQIFFIMNKYDKRIAITPEKVGESLRQEIV
ncbi:MAG TPA: response regulator, partial [Longilinea sp.]|nr:response regulator [Longilinea sp.]